MTEPRFAPKDASTTPAAFGKQTRISWVSPTDLSTAGRVNASQWQHAYALAIRDGVAESYGGSLKRYARAAGCTYDRLTKILRGDQLMRSEDVGLALALLPDLHTDARRHLSSLSPAGRRRPIGDFASPGRTQ